MNKVIHYCWFGGNPLPELAIKCIESWKKFFPEYDIKQWNEENFDVYSCRYTTEAYEAKKWAFVSDYARFKILREYGGLYFDTDVEVIKEFSESMKNESFMGCEINAIAPGLGLGLNLDCKEAREVYDEIIALYQGLCFKNLDGTLNQKTIVEYTTDIMKKRGFVPSSEISYISGINIYPSQYFCPYNPLTKEMKITDNSYSIHWFDASWYGEREKMIIRIEDRLNVILPKKISKILGLMVAGIKYDGFLPTMKKVLRRLKQ